MNSKNKRKKGFQAFLIMFLMAVTISLSAYASGGDENGEPKGGGSNPPPPPPKTELIKEFNAHGTDEIGPKSAPYLLNLKDLQKTLPSIK
ncbi:MAG: hypothetical protein M9962_07545 [Oligoflexia bacterium]|nr:hypothetical protein [Oligoflexia bacterium]